MHQHETQQANFETNGGGAAPEQRCCQYIKADGKGCRDWAVRGQTLCYRHGVFIHSGRGIDVPLLEDESSIVLVLSETLRAVALGTVPVKTGALLLDGCRLAHTMQMEKQKAANLERSRRRRELREEDIGEEQLETEEQQQKEASSQKAEATSQKPSSPEPVLSERRPEGGTSRTDRVLSPESCSEPCSENWDKELHKVERERPDTFDPRYEEIREGVLAAQAEPLDERMEEELAVEVR
jgi:hypothetical protein